MHKPIKFIYALLIVAIVTLSVTVYLLREIKNITSIVVIPSQHNTQIPNEVYTEACPDDSQMGLTQCALSKWNSADTKMQGIYNSLLMEISTLPKDAQASLFDKNDFINTQKAWVAYRDAECALEGQSYAGGSIQSMIVYTCNEALTSERIKTLENLSVKK